tara:strand:+ start:1483 stop:2469 length:987 start_codon:yes stop_codon:yes gene_type:complete
LAGSKGAVDLSGLSEEFKEAFAKQSPAVQAIYSGVFCGPRQEPEHNFYKAPCEKVIKGQNNSYIVLGRDRPASMETGYGGKGHTQCSMIDIVVGRMGANSKSVNEEGMDLYCNPSLELDAARIYISQKTNIDENFKLAAGSIGHVKSRSAIALKADGIRIIGREGIKLITRGDRQNSQGGNIGLVKGIDLISGNDDSDLQPIPKGDNVVKAIKALYEEVDALNGIVSNLIMTVVKFHKEVSVHTHPVPPWPVLIPTPAGPAPLANLAPGALTLPSPPVTAASAISIKDLVTKCFKGTVTQKQNLYIKMIGATNPSQPNYINSRFNKVN